MNELNGWLDRQRSREKRTVYLEDALFSDRFSAYAFYRLRFFLLRYGAASVVHATSFLLLYYMFSLGQFYTVLVAQAIAQMVSAFWWGCLELMRRDIRRLQRAGMPHRIPKEIARWLSFSLQLAVVLLVVTLGWVVWRGAVRKSSFSAADLYLLCIVVRVIAELVTRCYHSGIYAIRRIYRPVRAMLTAELAGFLATIVLWRFLHYWSLPAGALLATAVSTWLMLRYTRRAYSFMGFTLAEHIDVRHLAVPMRGAVVQGVAAGLGNVVMNLDSLLLLALFSHGRRDKASLVALFYLVTPTIRAGVKWAQLFYFDLKKLEVRLLHSLRKRFNDYVVRLAVLMGLLFWALTCVIGTTVYWHSLGMLYGLILPFFIARSLLAVVQVDAFADEAYGKLVLSGLVCATGFVAASVLLHDERAIVLAMAVVASGSHALLVMLRRRGADAISTSAGSEVLWLSDWLRELRAVATPVEVCVARFRSAPDRPADGTLREWQEQERWGQREVAKRIAHKLRESGRVTWMPPGRIAWYQSAPSPVRVSAEWLLAGSGGLLDWVAPTGMQGDGATALAVAGARGLLGAISGAALAEDDAAASEESVRRTFIEMFPRGVVYSPDEPTPQLFVGLTARVRRIIMVDASRFARDFRLSNRRSRFEVTALCVAGQLRLIFVVDRRADRTLRANWRALIRRANLQAAVGS